MAENLERTGGLVLAERYAYLLAPALGRPEAQRLVGEAAAACAESGRSLGAELAEDDAVVAHVSRGELERAGDPGGYVGAAAELTDRALDLYRGRA
jgi:3-carboxy-cis,cis-muconate cycloisomerase